MNEGLGELRVSKTLFYLIGNCVAFPIKQKALRGMRTRAKKKYVASDRARRENVPRHILFYVGRSADKTENLLVLKQGSTGGFSLEFLSLFD